LLALFLLPRHITSKEISLPRGSDRPRRNRLRPGPQPPDQSTGKHQPHRDQLRARHRAAKDRPAAVIVAQIFEEESGDAVDEHERANDLAFKLPALEQPHEEEEIRQLHRRLEQLRGFEGFVQGRSRNGVRQRIVEDYAPPVMRLFPVAASRGKAADAAYSVSQRQAGRKRVAGPQRRHLVSPHIPGRRHERGQQASGKNSARLQRVDAENLAGMSRVVTPLIDDVENLRPDNAAQHHQNAQVPCLVAVNSQLLGVAHTDPQSDQDAQGDQESIRRQEKFPYMKELWEHSSVRCGKPGIRYLDSLAGMQGLALSLWPLAKS
jgi:hypothetical protein